MQVKKKVEKFGARTQQIFILTVDFICRIAAARTLVQVVCSLLRRNAQDRADAVEQKNGYYKNIFARTDRLIFIKPLVGPTICRASSVQWHH